MVRFASSYPLVLASATSSGNVTTVILTDGMKIELLGAPALPSYNFFQLAVGKGFLPAT